MIKPQNTISPVFIFILFFAVSMQLRAQNAGFIDGIVVDAESSKPLFFVDVFLANTTIGGTTASDGYFFINDVPPGDYNLVVHHIGYELETRSFRIMGTDSLRYNFELELRVLRGEEVTVFAPKSKGWSWRQNLTRFKVEFLGDTRYARHCRIENPEVLNFQIHPETKAFIASSDQMLKIVNRALGYRIRVLLQEYQSLGKTSSAEAFLQYIVLARFEPLEPQSEKEPEKWQKNRQLSYEGSLKHFLSTLVGNENRNENFKIFVGSITSQAYDMATAISADILSIAPDSSTQHSRLQFDDYLKVSYGIGKLITSSIRLPDGYALIDTYGNLIDPLSLVVSGYWAQKRMADTLPNDYRPNF